MLEVVQQEKIEAWSGGNHVRKEFKILINNSDGKQNSSSGSNGPHKVSQHRQRTNAQTTEGGGSRNVTIQLLHLHKLERLKRAHIRESFHGDHA